MTSVAGRQEMYDEISGQGRDATRVGDDTRSSIPAPETWPGV